MSSLVTIVLVLAAIDFVLTVLWAYRWNSSIYVRHFKYKIPLKLIEANLLIINIKEKFKSASVYDAIFFGYVIIAFLQYAIASLHYVTSIIVIIILSGAILIHLKNISKTSNRHIIKMTKEYNKIMRKKS